MAVSPEPMPRAVLDTCVLYPATLRSVLLAAASEERFAPVWSERILGELAGALGRGGRMPEARITSLNGYLRSTFPDAIAPTAEVRRLEPQMTNDRKDRHVLAAAVATGAESLVTINLRDFPAGAAGRVGVEIRHPDRFLVELLERSPARVERALQRTATAIPVAGGQRSWTAGQVLGQLGGLGRGNAITPGFVAAAGSRLGIAAVAPPTAVGIGSAGRVVGRGAGRAIGQERELGAGR